MMLLFWGRNHRAPCDKEALAWAGEAWPSVQGDPQAVERNVGIS